MRRSDHQANGGENDGRGEARAQSQRLTGKRPAEEQRDDRIHKGVRAHARGRTVLQQIDVRGESEAGAEDYEISERQPRAQRDAGEMHATPFTRQESDPPEYGAAGETLHSGAQQRRTGHLPMLGVERTAGPTKRGNDEYRRPNGIDAAASSQSRRPHQQDESRETQDDSRRHAPCRSRSSWPQPLNHDKPQSHHGYQQSRQPGRNKLFRPAHAPVADEQQQDSGNRSGAPVCGARPDSRSNSKERVQDQARNQVPCSYKKKWGDRFDSDAHGEEIGRAHV